MPLAQATAHSRRPYPPVSCLTPMLGVRGGIAGDFTVTMLADDHFWMFGSGMAECYHQRFWEMVPMPEGVSLESRTTDWCGFSVAVSVGF